MQILPAHRRAQYAMLRAVVVAAAWTVTSPSIARADGVVMLAGGGSEGAIDDKSAWSARLYPHLWANGDVTGDGLITIGVLSYSVQDDWLPQYLISLGADDAKNIFIPDACAADDPRLAEQFRDLDAIFLKGGDQGKYYDWWNDRLAERLIRDVVERGGGIGGTSAGAMALAEFALAGSRDLTSRDVLTDACAEKLNDASDGGSSIHNDFLGAVPNTLIDTHVTQRGRLGRMIGAWAKAREDFGRNDLVAIGLDQRTGLVIRGGRAVVIGNGAVDVIRTTNESRIVRKSRWPLSAANLQLDRFVDGDAFNLRGDLHPARAMDAAIGDASQAGETEREPIGDDEADIQNYAKDARRGVLIETIADDGQKRGSDIDGVFAGLYVFGAASAAMVLPGSEFETVTASDFVGPIMNVGVSTSQQVTYAPGTFHNCASDNAAAETSTIVITWTSASRVHWSERASQYSSDGWPPLVGITGLRLHVIASTPGGFAHFDAGTGKASE